MAPHTLSNIYSALLIWKSSPLHVRPPICKQWASLHVKAAAQVWVEPGFCPESSTHRIKIRAGPNENEPEVQTHGPDVEHMKGHHGNDTELIHKVAIMEFVSSPGTVP